MVWKRIVAAFSLGLSTLSICAQVNAGGVLPTEDEVKGIERLCGGGRTDTASVSGNLDAAIKNWKNASAGASVTVAKEQLAGFMNRVKNDANLAASMKVYVDCVDRSLQRFLDQANRKPVPVSRTGASSSLLRSDFATDDDIAAAGCREANDAAKRSLVEDCGSRTLVVLGVSACSRRGDSPRSYVVRLDGECRAV